MRCLLLHFYYNPITQKKLLEDSKSLLSFKKVKTLPASVKGRSFVLLNKEVLIEPLVIFAIQFWN